MRREKNYFFLFEISGPWNFKRKIFHFSFLKLRVPVFLFLKNVSGCFSLISELLLIFNQASEQDRSDLKFSEINCFSAFIFLIFPEEIAGMTAIVTSDNELVMLAKLCQIDWYLHNGLSYRQSQINWKFNVTSLARSIAKYMSRNDFFQRFKTNNDNYYRTYVHLSDFFVLLLIY